MEKSKVDLESAANPEGEFNQDLLPDELNARPAWGSKAQYILAQVGFSVGLGNVWRFPYLCHQNGGGAFLLLYLLLLFVIGIPLFFLELAAGQIIRQGSIGVWKYISPRLAGIGFASCVVCSFVALYYNVIIAWSLFYLGNSFQFPLPWNNCPETSNQTAPETECDDSSPTVYFWYRKALHVTSSIEESGGLDPALTGCLFAAWALVCLAMIKGIKSSGKVLYFSSLFPYVVLLCFLVRALLLEGAVDGIRIMFTPKLSIWGDMQVWRQAATQVFFALGLGFGTIIAYSSYNPRHNNCHIDGLLVSGINFLTSVLATLVVFAVLGFRANIITQDCVERNTNILSHLVLNGSLPAVLLQQGNFSDLSAAEYSTWYRGLQNDTAEKLLQNWEIRDCRAEDEMNKGVEGTGLAFIAFTEAMTLFPTAPFWSVLFFFMLLNLGLSTMLGNMQGIITPLLDNFHSLRRRRTLFTVLCCIVGFLLGLVFMQRSGNYFVMMFDDYSATLPLLIVVAFEAFAVAWIYGADRFSSDIEAMLGWRPWRIYGYMWRFVSLASILCLLLASLVRMFLKRPTYQAWNREKAKEQQLEYPPWALGLLVSLIVAAALPIPAMFFRQLLREWFAQRDNRPGMVMAPVPTEDKDEVAEEESSPAECDRQGNGYLLVQAEDRQD
ncbi:sodium-dependent neutral amino acid transporter B(0)AT2-like [Rhineura floridana]|uniref:sodium-dependent neutral amino acid transporter B(0)AT2-like n=1 Tax=Rhineura floridana TaxID=261503 RepID=UPI002AC82704|nr:sodium-dependent neutral amino acid transporter B(0)AT2-like [Rhineura floridana]XP_061445168.1 sodium-dependent neutral amino acid transporter B(0)AT2-like [Rhineura floridana]XP_061445169.1 sodium-dependent neutral amino acid transporter B(0)AT2-like [Rhineura floridana]XP_061445170.1 sodium-dependent neutral amino acid transporter B(0)AT2-like [Rhineura floridana]XP_061445171.1 sodium-dependent neutral amino acid transporter B(0)AT2-like [Rhineura floridana]XP_061445172.1 sodium-dependen